ncbi:hypothetical protein [Accumulibacter sp.]|uniref:hypothetical protein n=1 Tax=Accumulibacter sp. TaxID=2053492 RepID=UPI0025E2C9A9|nr:hypothetical protein [Accumulibacter sp.]MCM8594195.1 hypothetical protein [Accumulibacter sp.]MCM8625759.1 hypothetical protein [Accumulibacter sp.]MDS4048338.1 hypothetical protein [Accumulibacter sp.]
MFSSMHSDRDQARCLLRATVSGSRRQPEPGGHAADRSLAQLLRVRRIRIDRDPALLERSDHAPGVPVAGIGEFLRAGSECVELPEQLL